MKGYGANMVKRFDGSIGVWLNGQIVLFVNALPGS